MFLYAEKIPLRKQDWQQALKYQVIFDDFTERHYIKKFIKRYSARAWGATKVAIGAICMNVDMSLTTEKLETISHQGDVLLCKLFFLLPVPVNLRKDRGIDVLLWWILIVHGRLCCWYITKVILLVPVMKLISGRG